VRIAAALFLLAPLVHASVIPMTLLSEDEAEPIHSAIIRKEAWTQDSVARLRAEADKRLKEGPWSVTTDRPKGVDLDPHEYYSEAPDWWPNPEDPNGPYIRHEGQANPIRFVGNRNALDSMCDSVFTLGTAAFLLDDARYAQRAARDINAWFLNPKTRMSPSLEHSRAVPGYNVGTSGGLLDGRSFIRAIQGMEFLAQTPYWDAHELAGVRRWFGEYLQWLLHSPSSEEERRSGNNHASWWTAQVAAVASFVEDHSAEQMAFTFYRDHVLPRQIRADGSAPREESRTLSLSNSVLNLEAFTMTSRIAQVSGVNLWDVHARNGANLSTVIDYLGPYLSDPRKWKMPQIAEYQSQGLYSLAFAGMGLKKPEYVAIYRKLEKPEGAWHSLVDLMLGRWEAAGHQTRH
jgi:Alginate lyase